MDVEMQAFQKWLDEYRQQNERGNGWYPQPSILEAFVAGFLAAKELVDE